MFYHYTSFKNARQILLDKSFKFGHFENQNDPFENLANRYNITPNINSLTLNYINRLAEFANKNLSVASFGTESDNIPGYYKPTMWAHYGENHKGVCFVFKEDEFIAEVNKIYSAPIIKKIAYQNQISKMIVDSEKIKDHLNDSFESFLRKYHDTLLFSKHIDWSVENETRFVLFNQLTNIQIEKCLALIVYGPEMDHENEIILNELAKPFFRSNNFGKLQYFSESYYISPLNFIFADEKQRISSKLLINKE